jgi:FAD/FMN-containing dehydrogenase
MRVAKRDHSDTYGNLIADDNTAHGKSPRHHREGNAETLLAGLYRAVYEIRTKRAASIRANWPRTWRNSAGYRLNYLLPWSSSRPPNWNEVEGQEVLPYPPVGEQTLNLAPLLAGSEGTLAIIRTATLRLVPKPLYLCFGVCGL